MKFHTYTKFGMVIWLEFVFEHANVEIRIRIGDKKMFMTWVSGPKALGHIISLLTLGPVAKHSHFNIYSCQLASHRYLLFISTKNSFLSQIR